MPLTSNMKINSERLWDSLMEMAKIGPGIAGGNNRQTLTDADGEGRHLFKRWCEAAGCTMGVDTMGNMFATRTGEDPKALPVYMGSHLDTQPTGGKYDGVLGVLGALEVVRTMNDLGIKTKHPIVVTNWTNEEGARFAPAMLASGVFAGIHTEEYAKGRTDLDDKVFGEELTRIGWVGDEKVGARKMHAMLELHIEQGPILEAEGKDDRRRHPRAGPVVAGNHADRQGCPHRLDPDGHARQRRSRHGPHHRAHPPDCNERTSQTPSARSVRSRCFQTRAMSFPAR